MTTLKGLLLKKRYRGSHPLSGQTLCFNFDAVWSQGLSQWKSASNGDGVGIMVVQYTKGRGRKGGISPFNPKELWIKWDSLLSKRPLCHQPVDHITLVNSAVYATCLAPNSKQICCPRLLNVLKCVIISLAEVRLWVVRLLVWKISAQGGQKSVEMQL